jgi:hypothetical protein
LRIAYCHYDVLSIAYFLPVTYCMLPRRQRRRQRLIIATPPAARVVVLVALAVEEDAAVGNAEFPFPPFFFEVCLDSCCILYPQPPLAQHCCD